VDTFFTYYELQRQPKKVKVDGVELVAQYGNCAFMAKRQPEFTIEMVNVLVFGLAKGVPSLWFGIELKEGEDKKSFAAMVEEVCRR
jgi:hypothetical protein